MKTENQLQEIYERFQSNNDDIETLIQKLKEAGLSQMECTRFIKSKFSVSLAEADKIIVNSNAWKEVYRQTMRLRDDFLSEASKMPESQKKDEHTED